jgi:Ti-type conjugative transfer relaxase TraA
LAIYHFSAKVISRANGSSAVAAAAYRSASELHDERLGRSHDFTNKTGVVHSEVMAPEGSPERWQNREALWNEVELGEKRKDAQLAREIEFSIPREMSQAQGVELARDFVQQEFVDRGMVADLNVHWDIGPDGLAKPHAHVMLSMREVKTDGEGATGPAVGFGKKVREWNSTELLTDWRERWAGHVNERLAELDVDARVDHRTLEAQGIELEPQHKIGPAGARRLDRGEDAERADDHREIARRNGEKIIAEPTVALDAITRQQSTFTDLDLARFVHRHTDDAGQFSQAMSAVKASPELVALGQDGQGRERFSTREMLSVEQRLERSAERLAGRASHGLEGREVSPAAVGGALAAGESRGLILSESQRDALAHISGPGDLAIVVGYAGTGKSAMLGVAREAWEAQGYQVRGAALSGIAAESLEGGSGIGSRTIASLEHGWAQGRDVLTARDVLVIDEAGMIGSRQMERVLSAADAAGAKVVLVGDAEQLQAIEAGAAFRALTERHGAAEITEIRRQREGWQREATRELATGRTGAALDRYEAAGMVRGHETREAARRALVDGWDSVRQTRPEASQVMLAHTRADVAELNQLARVRMRDAGALGADVALPTERGDRAFAPGDRLMFLRNERSMGVKNGSLGTLERIEGSSLAVRLDGADRREVRFDLKDYAQIDHGYASTIHKSQGVTVDHGHLLASDGLDRHAAYVGMSRHRETLAVHYGADDFKDRAQLDRTLSRERAKDTTLDYGEAFAERRGLVRSEIRVERGAAPEAVRTPKRSMFDGLKLGRAPVADRAPQGPTFSGEAPDAALQRGVNRYTAAWADAERMGEQGLPILPHQRVAMQQAREGLEAVSRQETADLRSALSRNPGLAAQGATPEGMKAVQRAMATERAVRLDPGARAERFVGDWRGLQAKRAELGIGYQTADARKAIEGRMRTMAEGLGRDAQVESILRGKKLELGLGKVRDVPGISMGDSLVRSLTLGRSIGFGR